MLLPPSFANLIREFMRLPGIGPKTSERLVFSLLRRSKEDIRSFAEELLGFAESVHLCETCFHFTDGAYRECMICRDQKRERSILCAVADSLDLIAIENAGFRGIYHVLHGVVNPLKNAYLKDMKTAELCLRISASFSSPVPIREIILGFDPNYEGELTARSIQRELNGFPITITRLARGLPQGGDLDYADEITLSEALKGRRVM